MRQVFFICAVMKNGIQKMEDMAELWDKLHVTAAAYNIFLRHILHVKGCEVDAVSLHRGQRKC